MARDMQNVRDTFLHMLYDNLTGLELHPLRYDATNPSADVLKLNALNVQFLELSLDTVAAQTVALDLLSDNEDTAVQSLGDVWDLLSATFTVPIQSYANPSNPIPGHGNVYWDRGGVSFKRIAADNYVHFSCLLKLKFSAINS